MAAREEKSTITYIGSAEIAARYTNVYVSCTWYPEQWFVIAIVPASLTLFAEVPQHHGKALPAMHMATLDAV
jgi:hypothetical protein